MKSINKIELAISSLKDTQYNVDKFKIFGYNTLDEADPKHERVRADLTVEIGGPSTHIKFSVLTREEHTIIKDAVQSIFKKRQATAESELRLACKDFFYDD